MKIFTAGENGYIDIIVYILVIVGGLVVNAYKNYAKKKEILEQGSVDTEDGFPEIPSQPFFEFEVPDVYDEPEKEQEVVFTPSEPSVILDVVPEENKNYLEGEAVFESTREKLFREEMHGIYGEIKDEISVGNFFEQEEEEQSHAIEFDLTKAVIYSEILKPKYI